MNTRHVRLLVFLLLLAFSPARGQTLADWKVHVHRSGLDTTGISLDSACVSRLAYELAYGHRPVRLSHWSLAERIDSARVDRVVQAICQQAPDWMDHWLSLEPAFAPYRRLRRQLDSLVLWGADSLARWQQIQQTLNAYRWLNRLANERVVVVSIPSATLRVLNRQGQELLESRVIVGSPRTPTPLFGAQLTRIITYPYWNVPRSIAVRELLPKIKRNPLAVLDALKMQVLDAQGRVVAPSSVKWSTLSAQNFPYRLRQSTGCDNALGLMKFDLNSPFDIYLHDTNHRELFSQTNRFLSHGCIRVAKPLELANLLLNAPVFAPAFLESRQVDVRSQTFLLPRPVPVVLLYTTVEVGSEGNPVFYPDVYGWRPVKL